jgi:hypothetical protein
MMLQLSFNVLSVALGPACWPGYHGSNKIIPIWKRNSRLGRCTQYIAKNSIYNGCLAKWSVTFIFQHFGNLGHKVLSSILPIPIFFLLTSFIFQVGTSYLCIQINYKSDQQSCLCIFGSIMKLGTALLLHRTQIWQNG